MTRRRRNDKTVQEWQDGAEMPGRWFVPIERLERESEWRLSDASKQVGLWDFGVVGDMFVGRGCFCGGGSSFGPSGDVSA
jgi:hypothetical protein